MTTNEAFTHVINTNGIYKKLNMNRSTVKSLRKRNADGEFISTDKKMEILIKAGYRIVQEMKWEG